MKKLQTLLRGSVALLSIAAASVASAADIPVKAPVKAPPPVWSWAGFYIGAQVGATAGESSFADPYGPSIYGDKVTTPGFLAGGDIGFNLQHGQWVFGLEADANWLRSSGTNTCFAFSGFYVSANCQAHPDALGTVTGRVGAALGLEGHTLVYGKGGAAGVHNNDQIDANNEYPVRLDGGNRSGAGALAGLVGEARI
jgi:opacity protein-like surface antigen